MKPELNFDSFFDNTSSTEALSNYAEGETKTFEQLENACWPKECKVVVNQLRTMGHTKARQAAKEALEKAGIKRLPDITAIIKDGLVYNTQEDHPSDGMPFVFSQGKVGAAKIKQVKTGKVKCPYCQHWDDHHVCCPLDDEEIEEWKRGYNWGLLHEDFPESEVSETPFWLGWMRGVLGDNDE